MAEIGKYIYGIINSNKEFFFDSYGVTTYEEGHTIPYQDISALVSDSEIADYTHLPKNALALQLVRHQRIIEKIMNSGLTVIPMRLGTFTKDETEVRDILNKGYSLIKRIMEKISNKIEIDLVATWSDFNLILKEAGEEEEIKEFKERFLSDPKGVSVEDQIKAGEMVKKALDKRREGYAEDIQKSLKAMSEDSKVHELMDDKMVINTAFLIDKARIKGFDRRVEELDMQFAERLNFRSVGPLPPYSFYTLEIKRLWFEEVDWARKRLGLKDVSGKDEIKKAYQRSAFLWHPDKNPAIPGIEKEFDEVTRAYRILADYCQVCEQTGQETYSFKAEDFKRNGMLIKVKE